MKIIVRSLAIVFATVFLLGATYKHGDMKSQIERKVAYGVPDPFVYILDEDGVTLELFGDSKQYTKKEAKEPIAAFFKAHPPKSCVLSNQGQYENMTRWFSGTYTTTADKTYEAYFEAALDQDHGHYHVTLMRVE